MTLELKKKKNHFAALEVPHTPSGLHQSNRLEQPGPNMMLNSEHLVWRKAGEGPKHTTETPGEGLWDNCGGP